MMPARARLWHAPRLLGVLWAFTRRTDWLPHARTGWADACLMVQIIARGWVRHVGARGFIARDGAFVHALYVHPSARGRGVGRLLLGEAQAAATRLELWVLVQNTQARAFYARHGFREVLCCPDGMGNDENLPDILMIWEAEVA